MAKIWVFAAGVIGAASVAGAAAASHLGLTRTGIAASIALPHAAALIALAALTERRASPLLTAAGWAILLGTLGFAAPLVARDLAGISLGPLAPVGGGLLILGWVLMALAAVRR